VDNGSFDAIVRDLANPTSRRRALWFAVGVRLAAVVREDAAAVRGGRTRCRGATFRCGSRCCPRGAGCRKGRCVNGDLAPGFACNRKRPGACASGVCGCDAYHGCICRTADCIPVGETGCTANGGGNAACCRGVCRITQENGTPDPGDDVGRCALP